MPDCRRLHPVALVGSLALSLVAVALASGCAAETGVWRQVEPPPIAPLTESGFVVDDQGAVNPWTHLVANNDPDRFPFAILCDRTGDMRPGVFEDAVRKTNLLGPEFVLCIGDLTQQDTEDPVEIDRRWTEFVKILEPLEMPFFFVAGNHDIANAAQARKWDERFGRSYYAFVYRDVLFLVLNTERGGPGTISDDQVTYAAKVLAAHPNVRWTCVFIHKPLWTWDTPTGWEKIEALLQDRPYTVFAGHAHAYKKFKRHGRSYFQLATTGGCSGLEGPAAGRIDEIVWVTMTDQGPRVVNLDLRGIFDEDLVTEPPPPAPAPETATESDSPAPAAPSEATERDAAPQPSADAPAAPQPSADAPAAPSASPTAP